MHNYFPRTFISIFLLSIVLFSAAGCFNINMANPSSDNKTVQGDTGGTSAVDLPVIESFKASPEQMLDGKSSTLSWSVKNATSVVIAPEIGTVATSGSKVVSPSNDTVYTLVASNAAGTLYSNTSIGILIVGKLEFGIPEISKGALPTIESFTASPESITAGNSSTLSWNVKNATSVIITPEIGLVSASGTKSVKPSVATMYTLVASNGFGMVSNPVTVTAVSAKRGIDLKIVGKPDLFISDMQIQHNNKITYWIENKGNENSVPFMNSIFIDGVWITNDPINVILPPGSELGRTLNSVNLVSTPQVFHNFEARADANNTNAELREDNNILKRTFTYMLENPASGKSVDSK
jgi:hypothetical protein